MVNRAGQMRPSALPLARDNATSRSRVKELPSASVLVLFGVLQAALLFRLNINWDEYFFLSHIHSFLAGRLTDPMQTFHVHILAGVAALPLSDPDQIMAGRLLMALCEAGALACLYRIARVFVEPVHALFAPVAWCGAVYSLDHGMSFRADPMASFLMMASLALLFAGRLCWRRGIAAGLLAALGLLVTIKSVFYLPAFGAAFVWRMGEIDSRTRVIAIFAAAATVLVTAGGALWLWHGSGLAEASAAKGSSIAQTAAAASARSEQIADKVLFSQGLFPRGDVVVRWAAGSALTMFLLLAGVLAAIRIAWSKDPVRGIALLLLAVPLASLVFYRNAFPYFFPFILFPAATLAALAAERIASPLLRSALAGGMLAVLGVQFGNGWQRDQSAQREIATTVHKLFPRPVPYIDRNGMIPSYPKAGFFMSTWGVEGVVANGHPALAPVIAGQQPPLVIVNTPVLEVALDPAHRGGKPVLGRADVAALRDNYIHHWGAIWVAGKRLAETDADFAIVISGAYTLECAGSRMLDGAPLACGSVRHLAGGLHRWSGGAALWRWGDHLEVPQGMPSAKPIYHGF